MSFSSTARNGNITNLLPFTVYNFSLTATNDRGESLASTLQTQTLQDSEYCWQMQMILQPYVCVCRNKKEVPDELQTWHVTFASTVLKKKLQNCTWARIIRQSLLARQEKEKRFTKAAHVTVFLFRPLNKKLKICVCIVRRSVELIPKDNHPRCTQSLCLPFCFSGELFSPSLKNPSFAKLPKANRAIRRG